MKLIKKPIEVIALHTVDGTIIPIKFKHTDNVGNEKVVKIDSILEQNSQCFTGTKIITYKCQGAVDEDYRLCEIKYEPMTGKWILYKM